MTINIPLSKQGKLAGKYTTIVDDIDSDLANLNWQVKESNQTQYALNRKVRNGKKCNLNMHRLIMERVIGRPLEKGETVDHIDGDGLNNQRANLRIATQQQNCANQRRPRKGMSSIYKGVTWHSGRNKWCAQIMKNYRHYYLGLFATEHEAHLAYVKASRELFGEFANGG